MKKTVNFLFCSRVDDFKKFFIKEFLRGSIFYKGISVTFIEDDFKHICYEAGPGGTHKQKFGIRRARRLLVIKQLLKNEIPSELLFEPKSGNYCLLCEPLDIVVFLRPVKKTKTLQIGTIVHYGSGFTKAIDKQRANSKKVKKIVFE